MLAAMRRASSRVRRCAVVFARKQFHIWTGHKSFDALPHAIGLATTGQLTRCCPALSN
jgi:hypothetical protein